MFPTTNRFGTTFKYPIYLHTRVRIHLYVNDDRCRVFVVPVVSGDLSQLSMLSAGGKEALWIDRGWRNGEKDPESKLLNGIGRETTCADYAEVDTRNLSTFYNPRKDTMTSTNPTPYATTTLLNRDDCNVSKHRLRDLFIVRTRCIYCTSIGSFSRNRRICSEPPAVRPKRKRSAPTGRATNGATNKWATITSVNRNSRLA